MKAAIYNEKARVKDGKCRLAYESNECCCTPPIGTNCNGLYNPAEPFDWTPQRACFQDLITDYPTAANDAAAEAYLATTSIDVTLPNTWSQPGSGCFAGACTGLNGATYTCPHQTGGPNWQYLGPNFCYTSPFSRLFISVGFYCEVSPSRCRVIINMGFGTDYCAGLSSPSLQWRDYFTERKNLEHLDFYVPLVFNEYLAGVCACKLGSGTGDLSAGPCRLRFH